jgi:predicted nucleic acid-binding protein
VIVLDTNVLSEIMKPTPEPGVFAWVESLPPRETAITAITVAEILYEIVRMPDGERRRKLMDTAETIFDHDFENRILDFDAGSAVEYASLVVGREAAGRPISMANAQIAAICRAHECALATRNIRDFDKTGISVVNPWSAETAADESAGP